ncbi:DUF1501 domain-containing protein [Lacibacter sediminis]|uniref:DUF1501 domain-containing protein n=1 Tax=Lacibacter sediminis TaxID=2760713 RepID=A0A7G5XEV2_9BACT|nr:DUF1501 domain-containing protein [Lacibacter sediminis]QNA44005.1 DUF1501 domain-containing protein [Lacibacter sediminis]
MKRRDFLQNTIPAAVLPSLVDNFSIRVLGDNPVMAALLNTYVETDRVLVIIQLNGGNDGLNMVIPLDQYSKYYNARSNIAIAENKVLSLSGTNAVGLHPSMTGLQTLYNNGKLRLVQAVGYPNPNFSHFRATDIWMSAADSDEQLTSGWGGRYLNDQYPNYPVGYPNTTVPDPLGIQIGSSASLAFQGPSVNMGISISSATNFYNLINGIQDPAPATRAGDALQYVRLVAKQSNQYSTRISAAAAAVPTQGTYPTNNTLADQLKIVARLIKGGLKTRVYMVSMGGFDTHSAQTNTDTSTGNHATLMQRLSDAVKAFQDDLQAMGIEDRVLGMTFSEFGRRIKSNASTGTDHGAAAPLFVFGTKVNPGISGVNPTIPTTATVNDNIPMQFDFRSVYATILQNWFCVDSTTLETIMLQNFQQLGLCASGNCSTTTDVNDIRNAGITLISNYPNPFTSSTTISFTTKGGHTLVQVMDALGRVIQTPVDRVYASGKYQVTFEGYALPAGVYYMRFQNGMTQQVKPMLKVR